MSNSFIYDIAKIIDMNVGLLIKKTKLTILGKNIIMLEGISRIIKYEDVNIIISCGKSKIEIEGSDLNIKTLSKNDAIIEGIISAIKFE